MSAIARVIARRMQGADASYPFPRLATWVRRMAARPHKCEFTVYSHTSYTKSGTRVMLCAEPSCPHWTYEDSMAELFAATQLCGCQSRCGDDGDVDGPGVCKGLPMPLKPPLVEVVLVHRDDRRARS